MNCQPQHRAGGSSAGKTAMGQLLRCVFQCQAVFEIRVGRRSWLVLYAWNLPVRYYHITARGDRSKAIHEDDEDRQAFLCVLASVAERFNWLIHAYGLMSNHLSSAGGDTGRQPVAGHALAQRGVQAVQQPASRAHRPPVPGAVQGDPGVEGAVSAGSRPLHRAQPGSRTDGTQRGRLAVEQLSRGCGARRYTNLAHDRLGSVGGCIMPRGCRVALSQVRQQRTRSTRAVAIVGQSDVAGRRAFC